jgi:long-chain fatty acid transport protein
MNKIKDFKSLILITFLSSSFLLNAQGFQVNLQGQAQQAMGGAGTALIQDGAAVFFNPGGVSFLKDNSINIGATPVISKGEFLESNTNATAVTQSPVGTPFAGYAVWGADSSHKFFSRFKFGLGAYTPFGSTIKWQDGWSGRFVLTEIQLFAVFVQPTISYKINDKWGVGGGFVYASGKVNLQQDLPITYQNGSYANATIQGNASGYGFNGGIYYKPCNKFSLGLTYRSQVNMNVKNGTATFNVPSSLASDFPNGSFTSSLPLPQVATLGLAYRVNEKLALAFDANFVGWYTYDTVTFKYANTTAELQDTKLARNYRNAYSFRLGAQYKLCGNLYGRVGLSYLRTPVKNGYVTPDVPDGDRLNVMAGLGYNIGKHFAVNASFTFEDIRRKGNNYSSVVTTTPGQTITPLSGTYNVFIYAPGLSLVYKF